MRMVPDWVRGMALGVGALVYVWAVLWVILIVGGVV